MPIGYIFEENSEKDVFVAPEEMDHHYRGSQ